MLDRRRFAALSSASALAAVLGPITARAQTPPFPTRFVRLVVPFPPGGGTDALARAIQEPMQKALGGTVIVDNLAIEGPSLDRAVIFQGHSLLPWRTVMGNVAYAVSSKWRRWSAAQVRAQSQKFIDLVGLTGSEHKHPAELSGGMIKRAALARALALDPDIVFLDEPTSGLDPIGAEEFDTLIKTLRDTLGLTVYMVTHDLDSLARVCDRIAALAGGKVIATGTMADMVRNDHPWLRSYFGGERARAAGIGVEQG